MRRFILSILFFFLPLLLVAQDVRLSPEEPLIYTLPNEYRIQSAEGIGERTLVVWGTTRNANDGSIVGELRYQMIDKSNLSDMQKSLTTIWAHPYQFVQVISANGFFLVVWNDRRKDSGGVYAQKVNLNGELIGGEMRITPGSVAIRSTFPSLLVFGQGTNKRRLIWRDNRPDLPGIYGLDVDKSGKLNLSLIGLRQSFYDVLHFSTLPGLTILPILDSSCIVVRSDGTVDERDAVWARYGSPYNLGPDTALIALTGKSLKYYASVFAKSPDWTIDISQLDSAVTNTAMVSRDSTGAIQVYFVRVKTTKNTSTEKIIASTIYRIDIDGSGQINATYPIDEHQYKTGFEGYDGSIAVSSKFVDSNSQQGYDNTAIVRLFWQHTQSSQSGGIWQGVSIQYSGVDQLGRFRNDSIGFIPGFSFPPAIAIRRNVDTASTVSVVLIDRTLELTASVGWRRVTYPLSRPMLASGPNNDFYCAWDDAYHGLTLARLPFPFVSAASIADRLVIEPLPEFTFSNLPGIIRSIHYDPPVRNDERFSRSDFFGYQSNHVLYCSVKEQYSAASYDYYTEYRYRFGLYFPTQNGWKNVFSIDKGGKTLAAMIPIERGVVSGYDPDRGELAVAVLASSEYDQAIQSSIIVLDRSGHVAWEIKKKNFPYYESILPVDSLRYLLMTDKTATLYNGQSVVDTIPLGPRGAYPRHLRLYGSRFLRTSWKENQSNTMTLEVYEISHGLRSWQEILLANRLGNVTILQRPTDSGVIVLWGTNDDGVHAALLDKNLHVIVADTVISGRRGKAVNPTGVFRGDTFYVAWEDYRNGEADIYGTSSLLPSTRTLSIEREEYGEAVLSVQLSPNPVKDIARVEFSHPVRSETELALYDMLGTLIWRMKVRAGSVSASVPFESRQAGAYRLCWRNEVESGSLPVVVW